MFCRQLVVLMLFAACSIVYAADDFHKEYFSEGVSYNRAKSHGSDVMNYFAACNSYACQDWLADYNSSFGVQIDVKSDDRAMN